jgi:branched-chain amino acid transport system substrate-binding protein
MKKRYLFVGMVAVSLSLLVAGQAFSAATKYTVPVISDFTGAYAELFKSWVPAQKAVFAWWSDTEGKKLGIELTLKHYDSRYDQTVVASMWPGILAECKPIAALGAGGPDVAALQQRLPKDKVPVFYGTAAYGYAWLPDMWLFHVRPLYLHEMLANLNWFIQQHPEKRPVKLGNLVGNVTAAIDLFKGLDKYVKERLEPKGLCRIVDKEFVEINPVDISTQVKKLIDSKSDIVLAPITTAMSTAYIRALQTYGTNIPSIAAPHHSIWPYGRAMKTYTPFEGHFVVAGHVAVTDIGTPAYQFYEMLVEKYKLLKDFYNPFSMMALNQSLLAVRAIEHAAKKVGAANLTGQAVYDAMFTGPFTYEELMGTLPTLNFTKGAPFPLGPDVKVQIETVKDGKYTTATKEWIPIPLDLEKW